MRVIPPSRIKHSCTQSWKGDVVSVFQLLCPVREVDWVPGWEPSLVISESGKMEENCLFIEPEDGNDAIWVVSGYEKDSFVDMYRVSPGICVSRFTIRVIEEGQDTTHANISYEHSALSEAGEKIVSEFTEISFLEFMSHFEEAINHYLTTGEKIKA